MNNGIRSKREVIHRYFINTPRGPPRTSVQRTHRENKKQRNRDAGLIKAAHSHDIFFSPFLLTLAPLNATRGRVLNTLQNFTRIHPSPAHSCPSSREARCSGAIAQPPAERRGCSGGVALYGVSVYPLRSDKMK